MMMIITFFIGLFTGAFSVMLYLAYLTAIDSMFVILPTGKTLGDLDRLWVHLKIDRYIKKLKEEELYEEEEEG